MGNIRSESNDKLYVAIKVVLDFVNRMNSWETKMYYYNRIKEGKLVNQQYHDLLKDLCKETLIEEYYKIIEDTCTKESRVYGGHPTQYGKPTKYANINKDTIIEVVLIKQDRIEIVAKGGNFPKQYYKFKLIKDNGNWFIDNLQSRISDRDWFQDFL